MGSTPLAGDEAESLSFELSKQVSAPEKLVFSQTSHLQLVLREGAIAQSIPAALAYSLANPKYARL